MSKRASGSLGPVRGGKTNKMEDHFKKKNNCTTLKIINMHAVANWKKNMLFAPFFSYFKAGCLQNIMETIIKLQSKIPWRI